MFEETSILSRCRASGLRLNAHGERIGIRPARLCPPDLLEEIRAHKATLLKLLQAGIAELPPDEAPWLHVALNVMDGGFDDADRSTLDSLLIGVRSIDHRSCQEAKARLRGMLGRLTTQSIGPRGLSG